MAKSISKKKKEKIAQLKLDLESEQNLLKDNEMILSGGKRSDGQTVRPLKEVKTEIELQLKKSKIMEKGFKINKPVWAYEEDPDYISCLLEEFKLRQLKPLKVAFNQIVEQEKRIKIERPIKEQKIKDLQKELDDLVGGKGVSYIG